MRRLYEEPGPTPIINTVDQCGKCKSDRIVTSQKGFDAMRTVKWIIWSAVFGLLFVMLLPFIGGFFAVVSVFIGLVGGIIAGVIGKGNVINLCANCGNKWQPGK